MHFHFPCSLTGTPDEIMARGEDHIIWRVGKVYEETCSHGRLVYWISISQRGFGKIIFLKELFKNKGTTCHELKLYDPKLSKVKVVCEPPSIQAIWKFAIALAVVSSVHYKLIDHGHSLSLLSADLMSAEKSANQCWMSQNLRVNEPRYRSGK